MTNPSTHTVSLYGYDGHSLDQTPRAKVTHLPRSTESYHRQRHTPDSGRGARCQGPSFANVRAPSGRSLRPCLSMDEGALHQIRAGLMTTFLRRYRAEVLMSAHIPRGADDKLVPALEAWHAEHAVHGIPFDPISYCGASGRDPWVLDHYCQSEVQRALRQVGGSGPGAEVRTYEQELLSRMRASGLSIGGAGVNSLDEVRATGANAIPRQIRETEQQVHSQRFQNLSCRGRPILPTPWVERWTGHPLWPSLGH